jgi:Rod binding domain-containing protein
VNLSITPELRGLPTAQPAGKVKAEKAAQDFEAVLLTSVLEALQKSFAGTSPDESVGSDNYALMGTQALAGAIAAHGGIGIARMILNQWQQTKVPEMAGRELSPAT